MLNLILTATLSLVSAAPAPATFQGEGASLQEKQDVGAFSKELKKALSNRDAEVRISAVKKAAGYDDASIVKVLSQALRDKDPRVSIAGMEVLRWMKNPSALVVLEKHYKSNKKALTKDPKAYVILLRAMAQHGKTSSIEYLIDSPFAVRDYEVVKARLYGLANIRSVKSLDAMSSMLVKVGNRDKENFMDEIRLALFRLTGEDKGPDPKLWGDWWRGVRKGYKLPETMPEFSKAQQETWDKFWGYEKKKKKDKEEKDG